MLGNKKILIIASCFVFLGLFGFVVIGYVNAQDFNSNDKSATHKSVAIKIPPQLDASDLPDDRKPQKLKTINLAIQVANGEIYKYIIELATTPEEQRIGMMFRGYIEENTGMLFSFKEESERNFWMKDTYIPLDILFIRKDGIITHIHHMAEENSTKRINSNGKVMAVLEISGGEAEMLGINIGDRVLYKDF